VIITLLLIAPGAFSQRVEILEYHELAEKPPFTVFIQLDTAAAEAQLKHVATVKATGSLKKPTQLFHFIKAEAQKMGANAYKIDSFKRLDEGVNGALVLSLFRAGDSILEANPQGSNTNAIYVFGDENMLSDKTQGYKMNGKKFEVKAGHFNVHELKPGEEIKINKGGFTGMTYWFTGQENKPAVYLTFGGLGVTAAAYNPGNQAIGVGLTTGRINHIDEDMAAVLLALFKQQ
jgi:hypothetical protein